MGRGSTGEEERIRAIKMTDDLTRIEENRIRFIKEVYQSGAIDPRKKVNFTQIGENLDLSKEEAFSIYTYFIAEGYFGHDIGGGVYLTHNGLKFVEELIRREMVERVANDVQLKRRFLITLFNLSGGVILHPVELQDIAKNMGLEPHEIEETAQNFLQRGIISSMGMGVYTLTVQGIDYIYQTHLVPSPDSQTEKIYSIFISHRSKEENIARILKRDLESIFPDKLDIFISGDPESIPSSEDWLISILEGIRNCDRMIVLLSPESAKREWIIFELGAAKILEKIITPVCYRGLERKDMPACLVLSRTQAIDMANVNKAEEYFSEVFKAVADSLGIDTPSIAIRECEFFKNLRNTDES